MSSILSQHLQQSRYQTTGDPSLSPFSAVELNQEPCRFEWLQPEYASVQPSNGTISVSLWQPRLNMFIFQCQVW